jgi:hypothetical protein
VKFFHIRSEKDKGDIKKICTTENNNRRGTDGVTTSTADNQPRSSPEEHAPVQTNGKTTEIARIKREIEGMREGENEGEGNSRKHGQISSHLRHQGK